MIKFKSINVDGNVCEWKYNSVAELEAEWRSDYIDMDLPANDDSIFDIEIDGKTDIREATFERIGTDSVWFEDLLTYLGIDIWN